ncbi:putative RNA-binding protein 19 isoform X2 [Acropora palmata]|uniref:putative RNA-binding protein 19 isoform X2 n=1 Tax=Acropora palmata TaxID=6131 RepID=UPI003DA18F13
MSRLIVKNLPKNIKEETVRSIFEEEGELTDLKLCYTDTGKFRRFAFIGYKTEDQAKAALLHFDKSFVDTSKITLDIARNLGDETLPRPWSKYSEGSSANKKLKEKLEKVEAQKRKKREVESEGKESIDKEKSSIIKERKNKKKLEVLDELADDSEFKKFLDVHNLGTSTKTSRTANANSDDKTNQEQVEYDDSNESGNEGDVYDAVGSSSGNVCEGIQGMKNSSEKSDEHIATRIDTLSDMDYLRSKVVSASQETYLNKKSKTNSKIGKDNSENNKRKDKSDDEDGHDDDDDDDNDEEENVSDKNEKGDEADIGKNLSNVKLKSPAAFGTVKMKGLPFKCYENDIKDFFAPLKTLSVRIIKNKKNRPTGCAFVDFETESDIKEALKRDKDCIEGRHIELFRDIQEKKPKEIKKEKPWMKKVVGQEGTKEFESIAESGRLFLRNLSYACSEEDLQTLFEKFGPLTETYLPLDKTSNKPTGIGFVTFMMPEHAVKAHNELDGKVFQGRLLHILPSKVKETKKEVTDEATSFKSKRDAKKKSLSSHDHNWNTLFLGVNAVADVMAEKYNTTKSGILDDASSSSLAVRMALGETQIVTETRKFLVSQGVKLDVFGQPSAKRSNTVIVVKNLPFDTTSDELRTIFEPFGTVARLVLPPSGITGLVEFFEQSQAKKAFQKLAYSKFKHAPLYLEWAPLEVFSSKPEKKSSEETDKDKNVKKDTNEEHTVADKEEDDDGDSENDEGTTLFVKNLNFDTNEETLKEVFSKIGPLRTVVIAKKKDFKNLGNLLSMGYGFVEYKKRSDALNALKKLQNSSVEGHNLELKMSHRTKNDKVSKRKSASLTKQNTSKILVRNVPFEASKKEIKELFGVHSSLCVAVLIYTGEDWY